MLLQERPDTRAQGQALAAFGLRLEAQEEPAAFMVWPCVMPGLALFADCMTQWQSGFGGPVGLRYEAVKAVLEIRDVPRKEWPALFDDLRIAEGAALAYIDEQRPVELTPTSPAAKPH